MAAAPDTKEAKDDAPRPNSASQRLHDYLLAIRKDLSDFSLPALEKALDEAKQEATDEKHITLLLGLLGDLCGKFKDDNRLSLLLVCVKMHQHWEHIQTGLTQLRQSEQLASVASAWLSAIITILRSFVSVDNLHLIRNIDFVNIRVRHPALCGE